MVMRTLGPTLAALVALSSPVLAQPDPPPPPVEPPPVESPPVPSVPAPDPAWRAYDDAFSTAARGEDDEARAQLLQLQTRWPSHPASARSGSLLRAFEPKPADPNAPSKVARGELVFWSTVGGVFVGFNVCTILGCESDRETAGVYIASVGGALGLSVLASQRGVRNGEAQLYNSAQTWGSWNGIALFENASSDRSRAAVALASQAAGLGAGVGLWQAWRPTQGDVALTNTAFLWTTLMTVWGHIAAGEGDSLTLRRVVIAGDLGILAGALASTQVKMSRGRTLLIDVGGILGILGGGLVAVSTDSEQAVGTALLVGTGAGLVIATVATDEWDLPAPSVPVSPMPVAGPSGSVGFGLGTHVRF